MIEAYDPSTLREKYGIHADIIVRLFHLFVVANNLMNTSVAAVHERFPSC